MTVDVKNASHGKKQKRVATAVGTKDDDTIRDKKKRKKKKKSKRQKTSDIKAIDNVNDSKVAIEAPKKSLMDSIFQVENSKPSLENGTIKRMVGPTGSSSLIDSIFDDGNNNNTPPATKASSAATLSLFNNHKIASVRKNHRQLVPRKQKKPPETKASAAAADTNHEDDIEAIRRTLRNRKHRSHHRPLLKRALDFPGVFNNEEEDDENGFFLLDDENERSKETADAVRDHGFCVLRNVVGTVNANGDGDGDAPHPLRDVVLPAAKDLQRRLNKALNSNGIHHSTETFRFREAASRCKGRTDVVFDEFDRNKMMLDVKEKILRNPKLFPVIQNLLGDVKLVYAGLIFSYPGSCDQPWHQDGEPLFPELPKDRSALLQASLPPYALNVFLPLEDEDGSIEKGPTEFLPGSHKWIAPDERLRCIVEKANGAEDDEEVDASDDSGTSDNDTVDDAKAIIAPVLKQGDALIYDYRVCHRGTANLYGKLEVAENKADAITERKEEKKKRVRDSENDVFGTRSILYLMYARPWFTDHINFDYTKSAKSLWENHKSAESNLSEKNKRLKK